MKSDDVVTEEQSIGMATDPRGLLHWLNTTPKPGHPCAKTLEREFPGALPGIAVQKRSSAVLLEKFGLGGENTIYGQSICPDEINNEKGGLADLMKEYWGEVFPMGGIGGSPYVGKTGFGAFASHVPDVRTHST